MWPTIDTPQPHHLYQVVWSDDPGERTVDRRARLIDIAHHLRRPWRPTTGHPDDPHGPRRIAIARANTTALPAITDYRVATEATGSDHHPIQVALDLAR